MGKKLWSLDVSSADQTFVPFEINLLEGGIYLSEEKIGNFEGMMQRLQSVGTAKDRQKIFREFTVAPGVKGYASIVGFGHGVSLYAVSILSADH